MSANHPAPAEKPGTPLVVGFDGSSTLAPRTGVGRAALGLARALAAIEDSGAQLRVLLNSLMRRTGPEHDALRQAAGVHLVRKRRPGGWMVRAWARGAGPTVEDLLGSDVRVHHGPAMYMPPARRARRIVSVYDLAFLEDPPEQREPLGGALFAEWFPRLLPACDMVVTASEFVRHRVIETYQLDGDRVAVVPLGVDPEMFRVEGARFVEMARHELGLADESYLLGVGAHAPRKRSGLLLDLYERLLEREPATPPLAVLGWQGRPPEELRRRPQLHRHVQVLGHVPDRLLAGLYTGAVATVITSHHEGFGFPVLEAQACGSPVVCGRNTSLPEVAGDAAMMVESDDAEAWADAVAQVAFDQSKRDARRDCGLANVRRFSWETAARRILELYRSLA